VKFHRSTYPWCAAQRGDSWRSRLLQPPLTPLSHGCLGNDKAAHYAKPMRGLSRIPGI